MYADTADINNAICTIADHGHMYAVIAPKALNSVRSTTAPPIVANAVKLNWNKTVFRSKLFNDQRPLVRSFATIVAGTGGSE